ncbi:MAG: thioesterase family protein [Pseudomonadota bacterium]
MTYNATLEKSTPLGTFYETEVPERWIDYNGHMNVGGYFEMFETAADHFIESAIGLDAAYAKNLGLSTFTGDFHICYRAETKRGERLKIASRVLGFDEKRFHLYQEMHVEGENPRLAAACEHLVLHVSLDGPKVTPLPADRLERLEAAFRAHQAAFDAPQFANRMIKTPGE